MIIIPGQLEIISCDEWGAQPPARELEVREYRGRGAVFHQTGGQNFPPNAIPATQRKMAIMLAKNTQSFHMGPERNWSDSGQHFTNSIDGILLEGRHGSIKAAMSGKIVIGAHCADSDANPPVNKNDSFGLESEGLFQTHQMNDKQMAALVRLFAWLSIVADFDSSMIIGHRASGISTNCPGDWLFGQTQAIRKAVHNKKLEFIKLGVKKP